MTQIAKTIRLGDGQSYPLGVPTNGAEKLNAHDKAISPYSKLNAIPLNVTADHTNKMLAISASGAVVEVAQDGWGVTKITNEEMQTLGITFGDVMNLAMIAEGVNLMQTGAVPFAYEVEKKDEDGRVIYSRMYSMFRASNSDIATWGGVVKEVAIEDGANLLISHPLEITQMEVTRDGIHATIAAMWKSITEAMNQKVDWNSRQPGLTAGMATELEVQTVKDEYGNVLNESQELLTAGRCLISAPDASSREATSQLDSDTSVSFKEMRGVTIGGNQMVKNPNFKEGKTDWETYNETPYDVTDGILHMTGNNTNSVIRQELNGVIGHKYLFLGVIKGNNDRCSIRAGRTTALNYGGSAFCKKLGEYEGLAFILSLSEVPLHYGVRAQDKDGGEIYAKYLPTLDLTTTFPTDQSFVNSLTNDEQSAVKVMHRLGFFSYSQKL